MGKIEWSMWANEQALASSAVLVLGGIITVAGMFTNYQFGIYGICAGVLVFLLEYPRGKRQKGHTLERQFQKPFSYIVRTGGLLTRNYFVRFVFYLILSVPCCFVLPTLLGGMCFLITSAIYFVAALKGEEWTPAGLESESESTTRGPKVIHPPRHPPPRRGVEMTAPQDNRV